MEPLQSGYLYLFSQEQLEGIENEDQLQVFPNIKSCLNLKKKSKKKCITTSNKGIIYFK